MLPIRRRTLALLSAAALTPAGVTAVAFAATQQGDGNPNTLTGGSGPDALYGLGSGDKLSG